MGMSFAVAPCSTPNGATTFVIIFMSSRTKSSRGIEGHVAITSIQGFALGPESAVEITSFCSTASVRNLFRLMPRCAAVAFAFRKRGSGRSTVVFIGQYLRNSIFSSSRRNPSLDVPQPWYGAKSHQRFGPSDPTRNHLLRMEWTAVMTVYFLGIAETE